MSAAVRAYKDSSVGVIELNRPDKFNCLSLEVHGLIDTVREAFEADNEVRSLLICAAGKHFCTGADLAEVKSMLADEQALDRFISAGMSVLARLEKSPLPVVAAVQGLCLAGGAELMLAADVVFAGASAKFGDQHAEFGLIPGWGGSQRLPRILGLRRSLDLMFSARWLTAAEAKDAGLVNYVAETDDPRQDAMEYAKKLGSRSRAGLAEMKRLAREGLELSLSDGLDLERQAAVRHLGGQDTKEGLAAFEARRKPDFS